MKRKFLFDSCTIVQLSNSYGDLKFVGIVGIVGIVSIIGIMSIVGIVGYEEA
ncbi:MAG: hypothetical protein JSV97_01295 [candidate division WOR-3 bacterium]|nr:MAG: hypothetical protein JSV97_01295 [candidate division WOR-3 bacterium]